MPHYSLQQLKNFTNEIFRYVEYRIQNHELHITLNRPEKMNAMNPQFIREIAFLLDYARAENSIWIVVVRAKGKVFSAGADLKAFAGQDTDDGISTIPLPEREVVMGEAFSGLHKPCLAVVEKNVYAGAFLIVCGCTHVLAADQAMFSLPEGLRGIWPMQVMASLLRLMAKRKALELCLRTEPLSAGEAMKCGLVSEVLPAGQLEERARQLAESWKKLSPSAVRIGLETFEQLADLPESEQQRFLHGRLQEVLQTEDAREGLKAFAEKRQPVWKGR